MEHGTIRNEILNNQNSGKSLINKLLEWKEEYTSNSFTEKYRVSGAPSEWNALIVLGIFRNYVINLYFTHYSLLIFRQ